MTAIRQWFVLALLALLTGCAALGLQPAESFNERLAYQYGNATAVLKAATSSYSVGALSKADFQTVIDGTDQAKGVLDTARIAYNAGDIQTAEGRLLVAIELLTILQQKLHANARPQP